jgi:hypothetical protein
MTRAQKSKLVSVFSDLETGPFQPDDGWQHPQRRENCEIVTDAGFSGRNVPLACVLVELLSHRQPDTVRGVMYAAVSAGWLPDTSRKSYMRCQRLLNELRRRRVIPFSWIVDNIRATEKDSSWSGLADFSDTVRDAYRRNFWASLPDYVCIIVEKDTVAGRILPVTREYDVPLHPLRGFSSTSFAFAIGDFWRQIEKPIHAFYIGDHDPSGRDIERSIRERLAEYAGRDFSWKRLAVEPEHFQTFNIIPLAPKKKDTRYARFSAEYGEKCAEVEAVPADVLRTMVEDAITSHIPSGEWERLQDIERREKDSFRAVLAKMGAA